MRERGRATTSTAWLPELRWLQPSLVETNDSVVLILQPAGRAPTGGSAARDQPVRICLHQRTPAKLQGLVGVSRCLLQAAKEISQRLAILVR